MHRLPRLTLLGVILLLASVPDRGNARINPIKNLVEQIMRPEVMILLDTSGSMRGDEFATAVGAECTAHNADVDLCNDGFCSGGENSANCAADCNIASNNTTTAGSAPKCQTAGSLTARMMSAKRALRHVLPDLRTVASISFATYRQEGYFRYYQGTTGSTKKVTLFLSEWELRRYGGWGADVPAASFSWNGTTMTLLSGAGLTETRDSLYRRPSGLTYVEKRFAFSVGGKTYNDGTYEWQYVGSYYTYDQVPILTGTTNTSTTYMGPQYVSGGTTWVHHRFNNDVSTGVNQFIDGTNYADGRVLAPFTPSTTQSDHDIQLGAVLSRLNYAAAGGVHGSGATPTRQAIDAVRAHFIARNDGTAPYSSPDPSAACRPRFLVVITDGVADSSPLTAVQNLYNQYPGNPIKTIAIGIPGSDMNELDNMADYGDDGDGSNNSANGYYAGTEGALINVLKTVLFAALKGDYVVSSAGVSTSSAGSVSGNLVILPSTEYPGWKGRLRALDLTTSCATTADCTVGTCHVTGNCASQVPPTCRCQEWEAGAVLAGQIASGTPRRRKLYTGRHDKNGGAPILLASSTGVACGDGTEHGQCTGGVTTAWLVDNPGTAEIRNTISWLVSKELGPMIASVPANVGAPPPYGVSDHGSLESARANRDKLIYITSNDGILHAFRSADGSEAFGYVPPDAWPLIYKLYKAGGQDADPAKIRWVLAQSPRVEDVRQGNNDWKTQLVLGMGAAGEEFSVIDITNPGDCTGGPPCAVTYNSPPFGFVAGGHSLSLSVGSYLGETRSIPSLYWDGTFKPMASFGSGYRTAANLSNPENEYYFRIDDLADGGSHQWKGSPSQTYQISPVAGFKLDNAGVATTPFVLDYAVLADMSGAATESGNKEILATYVATMNGQVIRMNLGLAGAGDRAVLIGDTDAGVSHPFHFGPAVSHRVSTAKKVAVAAVSGSYWELDPWMKNASFVSRIFLLHEDNDGATITDKTIKPVNEICTPSAGYLVAAGACASGAPSARALPVDRPLLIEDTTRNLVEAFFLYYDPPTGACTTGSTWLIRIRQGATGVELQKAILYPDTLSGGMTVVGGGKDIAISKSGKAGAPASVEKVNPAALTVPTFNGTPRIEVWREVR